MPLIRTCLTTLVLVAVLPGASPSGTQEAGTAGADTEVTTAPVVFDGDTLFRVAGVSSFPAERRAQGIAERLAQVAADPAVPVDTFRVVQVDGITRILAGDRPIMAVFDVDGSLEQATVATLAQTHLLRLRQAVADYRAARSPTALRRGAVSASLATLALFLALSLLAWLWRRVDGVLTARIHARIQTVGVQSFELMRGEQISHALRASFRAVRILAYAAVVLTYLGYVLALFPWTRWVSRNMLQLALAPLGVIGGSIVRNIPNLVFLVALFLVFRLALRIIRLFFEAVGRGGVRVENFEPDWAEPTYKILRIAVLAFGIVVAYPYVPGSDSAAFKGVSLFLGIVFSLGSSTAISNIIAGYMMTYRRAFKMGDRVRIGSSIGDVVEMRLQVTHLRSPKNEELIIPNSQILAGEVLNYSSIARTRGLILHTEVGIGYETPWRQVEAMLLMAADRTAGLAKEPRPFVLIKALADFAVTYEINAYCTEVPAMMRIYTDLHRHVLDVFNEYGVQIMTPAYEGDPAVAKVVPPKDWFLSPAVPPTSHPEEVGSQAR